MQPIPIIVTCYVTLEAQLSHRDNSTLQDNVILSTEAKLYYHFLLTACCNNVTILHHFRDIITCEVYVPVHELAKSLSFDNSVEFTSHVRFPVYM